MKQKKMRAKQLSFRAALLLFCALLATMGMAVGLHARYTAGASASDGARVAKFEITETGVSDSVITANLVPGEEETRTLTVQNKSEVAVEYTITVTNLTDNLPLTFKVGETEFSDGEVFTDTLPVNSGKKEYTLKICWPAVTEDDVDPKRVGMVDKVKVSISAIQID